MNDFKLAIECFKNLDDGGELIDAWADHERVILRALRIADRLMGEPSEGMIKAAWFSQYKTVGATDEEASKLADLKYESEKHISIPAYKAMRDQLLREIEQEQHH
jgi:hypothetical protein